MCPARSGAGSERNRNGTERNRAKRNRSGAEQERNDKDFTLARTKSGTSEYHSNDGSQ